MSRAVRLVLACAVLLVVSLTFLPWHRPAPGGPPLGRGVDANRAAVQAPDSGLGIAAAVGAAAIAALTGVALLAPRVPFRLPARTVAVTAATVTVSVVLKLVAGTALLGYGSWVSLVLTAVMVGAAVSGVRGGRGRPAPQPSGSQGRSG